MLVKVPVSWQSNAYDLDALTMEVQEFTVDMWFNPADLTDILHPADTGGVTVDYKRDITAMRVDTNERFRLRGCWSHKTGELIADAVIPVIEKGRVKA